MNCSLSNNQNFLSCDIMSAGWVSVTINCNCFQFIWYKGSNLAKKNEGTGSRLFIPEWLQQIPAKFVKTAWLINGSKPLTWAFCCSMFTPFWQQFLFVTLHVSATSNLLYFVSSQWKLWAMFLYFCLYFIKSWTNYNEKKNKSPKMICGPFSFQSD